MTGIEQLMVLRRTRDWYTARHSLLLEAIMLAFVHAYNPSFFLFFFFVVVVVARAG